jgi:hypothetical protein
MGLVSNSVDITFDYYTTLFLWERNQPSVTISLILEFSLEDPSSLTSIYASMICTLAPLYNQKTALQVRGDNLNGCAKERRVQILGINSRNPLNTIEFFSPAVFLYKLASTAVENLIHKVMLLTSRKLTTGQRTRSMFNWTLTISPHLPNKKKTRVAVALPLNLSFA